MTLNNYFTLKEIECKCGCGSTSISPYFLNRVNDVREIVGHPLRVNSWVRCPSHNLSVGGKPTSSHLKGLAVDLATPNEYIKYSVLLAAGSVGFRGVGVGKNFIHLDNDPDKPHGRLWFY